MRKQGDTIIEDTIRAFIQTAANVFKRFYGAYPDRLGLDIFTRMKQYNELPFLEQYEWYEMHVDHHLPIDQLMVHYERVHVRVDPAIFGKLDYHPGIPVVKQPERGHDEVICESCGVTVLMTLWFTAQGYHAIIWDKKDLQL